LQKKRLIISLFLKVVEIITEFENKLRDDNNSKLLEAKKRNSETVDNCFNYYKRQMDDLLEKKTFVSMDTFKRYENEIRVGIINDFRNECKFGELELKHKFETELQQKITNIKTEYKTTFRKNVKELETETQKQLNNDLNSYNEIMYHLLDSVNNELKFKENHEFFKFKSIDSFKQNCKIKEKDFVDQQIAKLEHEINISFNELQERLSNRIRKSESYYKKVMSDMLSSYVEVLKIFTKFF
jgi:light-regulated signal transduction histidine kinase (bacteriophytochrome)